MFLESMRQAVHGKGIRVVCPDGDDERALQAAVLLRDNDWAKPILLGKPDVLATKAKNLGMELSDIEIHDPAVDLRFEEYADTYYELRKHKGITRDFAISKAKLPHYFGALMVLKGVADGMVSGLNSETKPFLPAFEVIKLRKEFRRASSLFVLEWPERLLFFADCSVNINPDAQTLADIAHATIQTVTWFGHEPRVAFLSFSTHGSARGELVEKMKEATRLAKLDCPDIIIDGEIQFDAAFLPDIAKRKAPSSPFVEKGANVFIFPDLNSGNIAYKITERVGRAIATGPILQGLNHPINDVSRGCSYQDFANVVVLTAALANMQKTGMKNLENTNCSL